MQKKYRIFCVTFLILSLLTLIASLFMGGDMQIMNPAGWVGQQQKKLIVVSTWLMLIVVIPVLIMTFVIPWRYRKNNEKAKYTPHWDYSLLAESIWFGIPCLIIIGLSILVWTSSHELDPFKPLENAKKPLTIQVVALQWRWLFIYPEQQIATLNYVRFPEKVPLEFEITSDAPMNSFWIPKLGGQIYAMPGMNTKLHLIANEEGVFSGSSANLSGKGFANMKFEASSVSQESFDSWVQSTQQTGEALDLANYQQLALPSEDHEEKSYVLKEPHLYHQILKKYGMEHTACLEN